MNQPLFNDPDWPRASAWIAGECLTPTIGNLAIIGAPVRRGSISPGRCDLAPQAVRTILQKFSTYDIESDIDLRRLQANDMGDLKFSDATLEEIFKPLQLAVREALKTSEAVIVIGGDNGITRPVVHGIGDSPEQCGLITIDAHFDLRDLSLGLTNGNPVRALLDDGMPGKNIVQIGIQPFANSRTYAEVARAAGIRVVTMSRIRERGIEEIIEDALARLAPGVDAIHIDLDIDALDRIYAPATPGSRPGGLTPGEMLTIAKRCGAHPKVRSIDLVEVDPTRDLADTTVMITGSCLLSFASGVIDRLASHEPHQ